MRETQYLSKSIRRNALIMVHAARASHIGSALSIADIVAVLFGNILRIQPSNPKWPDRDRLILSKGHACTAIYAALSELGFINKSELTSYGQNFSLLMTHISHKVPGVEFSTGSLGHGLPFGTGKALAAKKKGDPWRTFIIMSDGEWGEGSNWEACMFAAHHKLDNLVAIVDYNKLQSLTTVAETLALEPITDKFEAFGWSTMEVDGHNHHDLLSALSTTPWQKGKPNILIAHTTKGKGVSFMENSVKWHYSNPDDQQLQMALDEIEATN